MVQANNFDLALLADRLRAIAQSRMASQQQIARATGVSQSTISKALNKRLKRRTPDLQILFEYSSSLLARPDISPAVRDAAQGFFVAGGSEDELVATITLSTRLVRGRRLSAVQQSDIDSR